MSKIVIIAPKDVDLADATKLLKAAGHSIDSEEPTAKALIHILLGLTSPNAYGFGPEFVIGSLDDHADAEQKAAKDAEKKGKSAAKTAPPPPEDDEDAEASTDDATDAKDDGESADADFNFESAPPPVAPALAEEPQVLQEPKPAPEPIVEALKSVYVDGELVDAVQVQEPTSTLLVEKLVHGPRTTYLVNESVFSFWPADVDAPAQRVQVQLDDRVTSLEVLIEKTPDRARLQVGSDLISLFCGETRAKL